MTDELDQTLDQLETQVLETLDNPYSTYRVEFPYTCSFTIPEDGNVTRVTIESRSEVLRYGRDTHDMNLQMNLDQEHGKPTYAKHLIEWTRDRMHTIDPRSHRNVWRQSHYRTYDE